MFDELIKLQNYFPKRNPFFELDLKYDFIFEEKCRFQKV